MSDEWFTRYGTPPTTLWEFSIDGLTEERAFELDRRIRGVIEVDPVRQIEERLASFDDDDNRYYQGYTDALRWALAQIDGREGGE